MKPRIVFMGSPDFSIPSLRALTQEYPVVGVVTQPDRPSGRGQILTSPPVKNLALELGIEIIQPERLKDPLAQEKLQAWAPDLIVVAAFGQILRKSVLSMPPFGCINVHASLLPRWRGAAPIQAAILNGDAVTGTTIMQMDPGIDTGPILSQESVEIFPTDTAASLSERLALSGADLLLRTLPGYLSGVVLPRPQEEAQAAYAPMLQKEEGLLIFTQPAEILERRVRAFNPWPGTFLPWQDGVLKVNKTHVEPRLSLSPGQRAVIHGLPAIGTSQGGLVLDEVQPAGKKSMPGRAFLSGARGWEES